MSKAGFCLIDNNALGYLLRNYAQFCSVRERIGQKTNLDSISVVVAPANFLEGIGVTLPLPPPEIVPAQIDVEKLVAAFQRSRGGDRNSGFLIALRDINENLGARYKDWLKGQETLTYSFIQERYKETLARISDIESRSFFIDTFEQCLKEEKDYSFLVGRIATEYALGFPFESLKRDDREFVQLVLTRGRDKRYKMKTRQRSVFGSLVEPTGTSRGQ